MEAVITKFANVLFVEPQKTWKVNAEEANNNNGMYINGDANMVSAMIPWKMANTIAMVGAALCANGNPNQIQAATMPTTGYATT